MIYLFREKREERREKRFGKQFSENIVASRNSLGLFYIKQESQLSSLFSLLSSLFSLLSSLFSLLSTPVPQISPFRNPQKPAKSLDVYSSQKDRVQR
jgi:hypothetical protein